MGQSPLYRFGRPPQLVEDRGAHCPEAVGRDLSLAEPQSPERYGHRAVAHGAVAEIYASE